MLRPAGRVESQRGDTKARISQLLWLKNVDCDFLPQSQFLNSSPLDRMKGDMQESPQLLPPPRKDAATMLQCTREQGAD